VARNTGKGFRKGAVTSRSQTLNPKTKTYVERDTKSGRFTNVKSDGKPFKGVRMLPITEIPHSRSPKFPS